MVQKRFYRYLKNESLRARIYIGQLIYRKIKEIVELFYVNYVKEKRRNKKVIENYIRNQLQEDIVTDQISVEEYLDSFTGEEIKKMLGK